MSYNRPYLGTHQPSFIDSSKSDIPVNGGIYIGLIKDYDTNSRSGRMHVYIPQFGGPDPNVRENWRLVSYASPFMGSTSGALGEYARATQNDNTFLKSSQSYGFYMTPPDIGSEVLCCFMPGSNEGYWFACVNSDVTRNMTPAIGAVDFRYISDVSIAESGLGPYLLPDKSYPVAETIDYYSVYGSAAYLPNLKKPLHIPQTIRLIVQGLDSDNVRGAISSSSQRDPVSAVFGVSTPGRPFGSQDPAADPNIKQKIETGNFNPNDYKVTTRIGGHSFVMDDGNLYGQDNLIRLKTAMGHQIMMNDTEGFIYVANSNGTAWVELTKDGDILVYGAKDFSLRAQGNVMVHSDNSISMFARRNINMQAGSSIKMAGQVVQARADTALNFYGKQAQIKSASTMAVVAGNGMAIRAGGPIGINGSAIALNGGGGGVGEIAPPSAISRYVLPDARNNVVWFVQPNALESINYKVPTHEPYVRGNFQQIAEEQQDVLDTLPKDVNGNVINPPANVPSLGPQAAATQPLTRQAPAGVFISQPEPQDGIGSLDKDQLRAFMAQTGYSESSGSYTAENQFGYQGKYQLGSAALQDLGYLKTGTPQTPEALNNPNNWTGKDGITSAADFRLNGPVQEKAMYNLTKSNYARLERNGVISQSSSTEDVAGLLSAAHLVGAGGATNWYRTGQVTTDANGTSAATYYNRGKYSQTQVPVISASNATKVVTGS